MTDDILKASQYAENLPEAGFARYIEASGLKVEIVENMQKYAGSFVKALAMCILTADKENLFKLVQAFRPYFNSYLPHKWNK